MWSGMVWFSIVTKICMGNSYTWNGYSSDQTDVCILAYYNMRIPISSRLKKLLHFLTLNISSKDFYFNSAHISFLLLGIFGKRLGSLIRHFFKDYFLFSLNRIFDQCFICTYILNLNSSNPCRLPYYHMKIPISLQQFNQIILKEINVLFDWIFHQKHLLHFKCELQGIFLSQKRKEHGGGKTYCVSFCVKNKL